MAITTSATWQITLIFGSGRWGWSELYYAKCPSVCSVNAMYDGAFPLLRARRKFLALNAGLEGMRIKALDPNSITKVFVQNVKTPVMDSGLAGGNPWNAMLFRYFDVEGLAARPALLRGVPYDWYDFTSSDVVNPNVTSAMVKAIQGWKELFKPTALVAITASNFPGADLCIRRTKSSDEGNPKSVVSGLSVDSVTKAWLVTIESANAKFVIGARVHLGGIRGCGTKGANGEYTIRKMVTSTTVMLDRGPRVICDGIDLDRPGYLQAREYDLLPMTTLSFERFVKRDTGRAFFGTRGRGKARS